MIGERGITLSGGQRQRVAIARALVVDPRILILDDATASVDASTEARIRVGLREAMRGRTTIIIAHRLSTIALADEVVVLDDGRVAARGTHDELVGDERRLPRDLRARPARARRHGGGRVSGPPGRARHLIDAAGGAQVDDWSWARTKRRLDGALPARAALQGAHGARDRLAARRHRRLARAAVPRRPHGRRGRGTATPARSAGSSPRSSRAGALGIALQLRADLLHRLDRRADARRPAQPPLPPPAAAVARLLRAEPRRRDHQPPDERRRGARPARHRRRHLARPEHADCSSAPRSSCSSSTGGSRSRR